MVLKWEASIAAVGADRDAAADGDAAAVETNWKHQVTGVT